MVKEIKIPEQVEISGIKINKDLSKGPYFVDGQNTLAKLWKLRCEELRTNTAHREKKLGIWTSYSWTHFYDCSRLIGLALMSMGLQRGEVVSILSEDNKEWIYTDLAIQSIGGICSGVYPTDSARQLIFFVNDSKSKFLFLENDEQLDKYLSVADQMPDLLKVIVYEKDGLGDFHDPRVMFLDELYKIGETELKKSKDSFEYSIEEGCSDDTAILIYTSGTTGDPKGVEITGNNIMFSISAGGKSLPVNNADEQLCFLPLCHILERLISVFQPIGAGSVINFAESSETVFENLQEISPTIFTAVPRVWERIYSRVLIMVGDATPFGKWAFSKALSAGMKKVQAEDNNKSIPISYIFWNFILLRNMRRILGMDNLRRGTTGAAPISPELLTWFRAIGVRIFEGYGMSESTGLISLNYQDNDKNGTVGPVIPGAKLRIGENDEIQYQGGNCFKGYWRKPEKTNETYTDDGWMRTGDIGLIDSKGFLTITGRMKDIIITAGGKNITPSEIENRLKFSPYISDTIIIGDQRKFVSCLVMIDQENVEKFAQDNRVPFSDFASLCASKEILELIHNTIEEVNKDFARAEQIKKFRLIDILLTAEDDELTATMKLKRGFVEEKHKTLIDEMYL
jgi:long-chain acyl-CoA synthetase